MSELAQAALESWDRQCKILMNVANAVQPDQVGHRTRSEEWSIGEHLRHVHFVRLGWLASVDADAAAACPRPQSPEDLEGVREALKQSAAKIREVLARTLETPQPLGPYDHPMFFLQHMIWHEGWHVSSIMQAHRANGHEPTDEWEEENLWSYWRTE